MTKTYNFNITSDQRRALADTTAAYFHSTCKYTMPGFRYVIGDKAEIERDGTLVLQDGAEEYGPYLLDYLDARGFQLTRESAEEVEINHDDENVNGDFEESTDEPTEVEEAEEENSDDDDQAEKVEDTDAEEPMSVKISIPDDLADEEFNRLDAILTSKATILKHAFQSEGIALAREDGKISIDGFPAIDGDHTEAYAQFVTRLVDFARNATRVVSTDHEVENEKYFFRIFLLRLGMNGKEFKQTRKILLENLSGNAAFKTDAQLKAHSTKWAEKRKAAKTAEQEEIDESTNDEVNESAESSNTEQEKNKDGTAE